MTINNSRGILPKSKLFIQIKSSSLLKYPVYASKVSLSLHNQSMKRENLLFQEPYRLFFAKIFAVVPVFVKPKISFQKYHSLILVIILLLK